MLNFPFEKKIKRGNPIKFNLIEFHVKQTILYMW